MTTDAIKDMLVEADKASTFAGSLYKRLLPLITGTVQAFLIDVLFEGNKLSFKVLDDQYRKDKLALSKEELSAYRLYSKSAMGLSRAKRSDEIETDLATYFFLEFKVKGDTPKVAKEKATKAVAALPDATKKAVVQEIKATGKTASEAVKGGVKAIHKAKSVGEVEKYLEQASEEIALLALISKARKGGHVELARILELALPLTKVSIPVADKLEKEVESIDDIW